MKCAKKTTLASFIIATCLLGTTMALAHMAQSGWMYPPECCAGRDCAVLPRAKVKITGNGYVIRETGELIRYGDSRIRPVSPDGDFHWCTVHALKDGEFVDTKQTRCFIIPLPAA